MFSENTLKGLKGFAQVFLQLCLFFYFLVFSLNSDLGVHVDGFISNVAHSFVIGATKVRVHIYILFFPATFYKSSQLYVYLKVQL